MRNELCIDNRNEPKWAVTLNAANASKACKIVYAALFIPDQNEHGEQLDAWPNPAAIPEAVRAFFAAERNAYQNGAPKNLWSIDRLDNRITSIRTIYHWDRQDAYMEEVLATANCAREGDLPVAVLVDPCNGIANTRHDRGRIRHRRVDAASVATLWAGLKPGDVLVIWQWPQPDRIRANCPVALLQAAIAVGPQPLNGIQEHAFGPFVMLELRR